jgi:transcriptional regulator with XRE-family HTH domain
MILGEKIERIREFRGIKQETLAASLGISQQSVSKLEKEDIIDDEKLQRVADALGVTPEVIKNFDEQKIIYNINNHHSYNNTFNDSSMAISQQFNPLEKIVELYERLLELEREKVSYLQNKTI